MIWVEDPWFVIEPLIPAHYPELYLMEVAWDLGARWRFAGRTPSFAEYTSTLWDGVLGHGAVRNRRGELIGLVSCYEADLRHGTAWVATIAADRARGQGLLLLALGHLITDLFTEWPFRRLYADSLDTNFANFASGDRDDARRAYRIEGRLVDDLVIEGEVHDRVIVSFERDEFLAGQGRVAARRRARAATRAGTTGGRT